MLRYRLDDLGWYQFECMVQSLLKSWLGMGIESWAGRGDHGRDAFFKGALEFPIKGRLQDGPFVFQVKFIEEANAAGANPRPRILSALNSEKQKIKARKTLNESKIVYSLFTNAYLNPDFREELIDKMNVDFPLFDVVIMAGQDICDLLDNSASIRVSFPQILSLKDLDSLLNNVIAKPIIERSRGMIEDAREISSVFYPTNAYSETIKKLAINNFAVLEGPPEVGKTAIARMIGLSQLSIGWEAYECLSPNDFFQLFSNENQQIFIADDAFGSTEYDPTRSSEWSLNLDRILRRVDHNHWLIWTARKHILEIALQRMRLQGKGENFPDPGAILIDAGALTKTEKAMILYRHAKASGLEKTARNLLKIYADMIVSDTYFTPERIRRFVKHSFPSLINDFNNGKLSSESLTQLITKEIKEPTKSLSQAFNCLSEGHKKVLISRLDLDSSELLTDEEELFQAFDRHRPQYIDKSYDDLKRDLSSSFLKEITKSAYIFSDGGWVHPSMRDLVIAYLINHKDSRLDFLKNCSIGGISLSLSIGGGSEGKRVLPLVIDDEDQSTINKRIKELVFNIDINELTKLLGTINEAKINSTNLEDVGLISYINDIYEIVLDETILRWQKKDDIIDINLLNLYYSMAKESKIYRPPAPLKYTWDNFYITMSEAAYNSEDYIEDEDHARINRFLDLVNLINIEDHRFLKYVNFPDSFSQLATNFIKACIDYAQSDYSISSEALSNYDLYSSEAAKFNEILETVKRFIKLWIKLQIDIEPEEVLKIIAKAAYSWDEKAQEEYEGEPDYDDYRSVREEEYIDIDTLFSDL